MNADKFITLSDKLFLRHIFCKDEVYTIEPIDYSSKCWFDKTSCEALINRVFIDDFFNYTSAEELRECGLIVAEIWRIRLKAEYPEKTFMVFLTLDEGDSELEFSHLSCTLRFCLKRDNEPAWCSDKTNMKTFFVWET